MTILVDEYLGPAAGLSTLKVLYSLYRTLEDTNNGMDLGVDIAELLLVFSNYFANQTDDKDARAVGITLTVLPVGIKAGYHTLHLDSTYGKVSAGVSATLFVLMMFRMAPK